MAVKENTDMAALHENTALIREGIDLDWIPIGQMRIEPKYQREHKPSQITKMALEWDYKACGALCVTRRAKSFYIIDGQHRWLSALENGTVTHLPCVIYDNMTVAQEARLFVMYNGQRRNTNLVDIFKARLAEGDPTAHQIQNVLTGVGWGISKGSGGYFQAVTTAREITERFGIEVFAAIVNVVNRAWDDAATSSSILRAIASLYSHYSASEMDWDVLEKALRGTTKDGLLRAATARRLTSTAKAGNWQSMPGLVAITIAEMYNHSFGHRRTGRWSPVDGPGVFNKAYRAYRHEDLVK